MLSRTLLCFALLSATGAMAAAPGFLLGVDYSERLSSNATQIATDSSGALYILSSLPISNDTPPSSVTKLSANGKTVLWQNQLGFAVSAMAVDPNGGVYVTPVILPGETSLFVAKLNATGVGIAWKKSVGFLPSNAPGTVITLTADSSGRAYVAGYIGAFFPFPHTVGVDQSAVVRLNAAGSTVDYSALVMSGVTSIAVDGSGAAVVAGLTDGQISLAQLAPDGSAGFNLFINEVATVPGGPQSQQTPLPAVALDANGNGVVYAANGSGFGLLQRFDSKGAVTFSKTIPSGTTLIYPALALDAAGNTYVTGSSNTLYPARNSLAKCGSDWLSVFGPDGSLLQSTYIPGGKSAGIAPLVAIGANSTVFVVDLAGASFTPTQADPVPASEGSGTADFLWSLSSNATAQTFPLACIGNAASYDTTGPIAPGEIVTLFGSGLGPEQGMQAQATLPNQFPTQVTNVEVTFDGKLAPLLWMQEAQINVVAPWSLSPGQTTQVCVSYNSVKTNCLAWPVAQASPGVFTVDGVYAAAVNQDGTINSEGNEAAPGSIVTVFATGLGPITPPQADGSLVEFPLPKNVLLVGVLSVEVGAISMDGLLGLTVTYAGPAPYQVAGISQINFKIPSKVGANGEGAIYVKLPSAQSQPFRVYVTGQ